MNKELIISSNDNGAEIALLENRRLVEIHREDEQSSFNVGDIIVGRVRKVVPGLNAAFVDVGYEKDAFLHYTDLGPRVRSLLKYSQKAMSGSQPTHLLSDFKMEDEIEKTGNVKDVLKAKQPIVVQVLKEPISTKGPRLTCEITLPGRFLVLAPFSDTIGVSKQISTQDERKRLQRLIESIKPKNFGVVVRTAAESKSVSELHEDLTNLTGKWENILYNLNGVQPPKKAHSELKKSSTLVRDMLSDSFNKIVVDERSIATDIENYINKIAPEKKSIVSHYTSDKPLFDNYGITKQIKSLFGKTVTLPSGAYLVIEHTEALHVIDVNSGQKMSASDSQQTTALNVNIEAADEIARQLRLRDIGGIVIVDFIDLKNNEDRKKIFNQMKEAMKYDKAKHTVLPLSRFGLMQITRQRVRPEVNITTQEKCPTCSGTGQIESSLLIVDKLERHLREILKAHSSIKVYVHPFLDAYLKKGLLSLQLKWMWKYFRWIRIIPNNNYPLTDFHFFSSSDEEITVEEIVEEEEQSKSSKNGQPKQKKHQQQPHKKKAS